MAEDDTVGDFANRLQHEFEDHDSDASDMMESQDWFVNDKREDERAPSPTVKENDGVGAAAVVSLSSVASPASKATVSQATSNTAETPEVREPPSPR